MIPPEFELIDLEPHDKVKVSLARNHEAHELVQWRIAIVRDTFRNTERQVGHIHGKSKCPVDDDRNDVSTHLDEESDVQRTE